MAGNAQEWREETVRVAGTDLTLIQGGTGKPLLVLHEELGHPGWLRWHAALAQNRTLLIPLHPSGNRHGWSGSRVYGTWPVSMRA